MAGTWEGKPSCAPISAPSNAAAQASPLVVLSNISRRGGVIGARRGPWRVVAIHVGEFASLEDETKLDLALAERTFLPFHNGCIPFASKSETTKGLL